MKNLKTNILILQKNLISDKIQTISEVTGASTLIYSEQLDSTTSIDSQGIVELEQLYVDLWDDFFIEDELFEIDTQYRPAITAALDATADLVESGKITFELANSIDRETYTAIFYSKIGDNKDAVAKLNDVFVLIKNGDPIKVTAKQTLSYRELEDTLLNIMTKSQSIMSRDVKEEVAFIFSRGTGPLYVSELDEMLDLLTKARFLDVILRNTDPLYRIIHTEWESTKNSLTQKTTIEELLDPNRDPLFGHHSAFSQICPLHLALSKYLFLDHKKYQR